MEVTLAFTVGALPGRDGRLVCQAARSGQARPAQKAPKFVLAWAAVNRLLLAAALAACGGGNPSGDAPRLDARPGTADAPPGTPDAPPGTPDAPPVLSCANYCATVMAHCAGTNAQWETLGDCLASCATWPLGTEADNAGNTLGCRLYHAGVPATNNATIHCPHGGPSGDAVCGTNCNGFCTLVQGVCTGADQVYASFDACRTACMGFPSSGHYTATVTTGDSYACRLFHAAKASTQPAAECANAAASSPTCQ